MKKPITIIVIVVVMLALAVLAWVADLHREAYLDKTLNHGESNLYALTTVVIEVDRDNDTVTCEDYNGNLWEFYGAEDWVEGDCASLLMNSQGTQKIYDDTIEGAKYSAWTLDW